MIARWRVDRDAMVATMKDLGLKKRVRVVRRRLPGAINGRQETTPTHHLIEMENDISPAQANSTLLHELCHCRQREALGATAELTYTLYDSLLGYDSNPLELEAEAFANDHWGTVKVAVAA